MKIINTDKLWKEMQEEYTDGDCGDKDRFKVGINVGITKCYNLLKKVPAVKTKQVKYYDEKENVWKIGSVIVE